MPNKKMIAVNVIVFCFLMIFALPQLLAGKSTEFSETYLDSPDTVAGVKTVPAVNDGLTEDKANGISGKTLTLNSKDDKDKKGKKDKNNDDDAGKGKKDKKDKNKDDDNSKDDKSSDDDDKSKDDKSSDDDDKSKDDKSSDDDDSKDDKSSDDDSSDDEIPPTPSPTVTSTPTPAPTATPSPTPIPTPTPPLGDPPLSPQVTTSETCTSALEVTATGVVDALATKIRIEGGLNIVEVDVVNNGFTAVIPLQLNRVNHLFFFAIAVDGATSAPSPVSVTQDGQAPTIFIDFPEDGLEVTNDTVVIAGRVSDLLSGFMGLDATVNGLPADVIVGIGTNGTFERQNVPLVLGPNTITATATDKKGNTVSKQITINRIEIPVDAPTITVVSGNNQRARVNSLLPDPIVVKIINGDGSPFVNKIVNIKVIRSNGRLTIDGIGKGSLELQTRTDANGLALAFWALGSDAGCGNNRIEVLSAGIVGTTFFCASADPDLPKQMNIGSGNNQRAEAAGPAPEPLKVWVNDACNGVEGVPVTFTVTSGNGKVNNASTTIVNTGVTGHAEVNFVLGQAGGNNIVEANFPGNPGNPAVFNLFGVIRDALQPTTFSGLALNNSNLPVGNADCVLIVGNNAPQITTTDVEGQFTFNNVAGGGRSKLIVDGLTATTLNGQSIAPGSFPALAFEPIITPNAANSLPTPVLLPPLDPVNARAYDGTQDVVLTVDGIEGLEMVVKAGSMTRADGTIPSPADPATIALNKVHFDKVPMPMPDGAAPPFAWTLQPAGAIFDPPVDIIYPNMSGLPAGSIAYFLSFDHDTNRFEIVATGHVTDDGFNILSDPGAGIVKAGWGCNCPRYASVGDCEKCILNCEDCVYTCISSGALQGGSVAVNGIVPVNNAVVCEGEIITFTASGVAHVGGRIERDCPDFGKTTISIAGDPTYTWKITSPALPNGEITGVGKKTDPIENATAGVYTCVFTAKVVDPPGSQVSCAPADLPLGAVTATAVKVELVTPKGDPVLAPIDSGDGQNEFTFSGTSPGVFTINFKAKVVPAGVDLNKVKNIVKFTMENVGQPPVWEAGNPNGQASVSGGFLVAKATFTGLPANNSDFGKKKVTIECDGIKKEEVTIEVFFPRDSSNNPEGIAINWFFYWNQTGAGDPDLVYSNDLITRSGIGQTPALREWSTFAGPRDEIRISDAFKGILQFIARNNKTGIDGFANVVIHENRHVQQIVDNNTLPFFSGITGTLRNAPAAGWSFNVPHTHNLYNHFNPGPDNQPGIAGVDDDNDGNIDEADEYVLGLGGDVDLDIDHDDLGEEPGGNNFDGGSISCETQAEAAETIPQDQFRTEDWADPGKQHGPDGGSKYGEINSYDN